MTWILILTYLVNGVPALTSAGDFTTAAACHSAGKQWSQHNNLTYQHAYMCIEAQRS